MTVADIALMRLQMNLSLEKIAGVMISRYLRSLQPWPITSIIGRRSISVSNE
jgi:hypothetical protein